MVREADNFPPLLMLPETSRAGISSGKLSISHCWILALNSMAGISSSNHQSLGSGEGESEGETDGLTDGLTEGDSEGEALGDTDGDTDGDLLGDLLGDTLGDILGDTEGEALGDFDGDTDGLALGDLLGEAEGLKDGDSLGETEALGLNDGDSLGLSENDIHPPLQENANRPYNRKPTPYVLEVGKVNENVVMVETAKMVTVAGSIVASPPTVASVP